MINVKAVVLWRREQRPLSQPWMCNCWQSNLGQLWLGGEVLSHGNKDVTWLYLSKRQHAGCHYAVTIAGLTVYVALCLLYFCICLLHSSIWSQGANRSALKLKHLSLCCNVWPHDVNKPTYCCLCLKLEWFSVCLGLLFLMSLASKLLSLPYRCLNLHTDVFSDYVLAEFSSQ